MVEPLIPYARTTDPTVEPVIATCPVCGEEIELHERKDFESFSMVEYQEHYEEVHNG